MTSKPCSLIDALTAHEYDDLAGVIPVNIAEALLAIATAINRLADIDEKRLQGEIGAIDRIKGIIEDGETKVRIADDDDTGGHA